MQAVPAALQKLFAAGLLFARRSNFARPFALECMNTRINRQTAPPGLRPLLLRPLLRPRLPGSPLARA